MPYRSGGKAPLVPELPDVEGFRGVLAEHALDRVRARFGEDAMVKGLAFDGQEKT